MTLLGNSLSEFGAYDEAAILLDQAAKETELQFGRNSEYAWKSKIAKYRNLKRQCYYHQFIGALGPAIEELEEVLEKCPDAIDGVPVRHHLQTTLGRLHSDQAKNTVGDERHQHLLSAIALHEASLEKSLQFHGPDSLPSIDLMLLNASCIHAIGREAEALDLRKAILARLEQAVNRWNIENQNDRLPSGYTAAMVTINNNLGTSYDHFGRFSDAFNHQSKALGYCREIYSDEHPKLMVNLNNFAVKLETTNDIIGASAIHELVLPLMRKKNLINSTQGRLVRIQYARSLARSNQCERAIEILTALLQEAELRNDPYLLAYAERGLIETLMKAGRYQTALPRAESLYTRLAPGTRQYKRFKSEVGFLLADAYMHERSFVKAIDLNKELVELGKTQMQPENEANDSDSFYSEAQYHLGKNYCRTSNVVKGIPILMSCIQWNQTKVDDGCENQRRRLIVAKAYAEVADSYFAQQKLEDSAVACLAAIDNLLVVGESIASVQLREKLTTTQLQMGNKLQAVKNRRIVDDFYAAKLENIANESGSDSWQYFEVLRQKLSLQITRWNKLDDNGRQTDLKSLLNEAASAVANLENSQELSSTILAVDFRNMVSEVTSLLEQESIELGINN